jgi:hypothetical protein
MIARCARNKCCTSIYLIFHGSTPVNRPTPFPHVSLPRLSPVPDVERGIEPQEPSSYYTACGEEGAQS